MERSSPDKDESASISNDFGNSSNNTDRDSLGEEKIWPLDEDHFSDHSELELLEELEINSNLSREEQIEMAISRLTKQLSLTTEITTTTTTPTETQSPSSDHSIDKLSTKECQDKKKRIVKRICDLKVKLVKLREKEDETEFGENSSLQSASDLPDVFMARRQYSFRKNVAGHKLVLTADIFENENRLRTAWKKSAQTKPTAPTSTPSPGVPATAATTATALVTSTLQQTTKILQLINNTSNQLYILANNLSGGQCQATNPFSPLVCDHCCIKSAKSIHEVVLETFKLVKPSGSRLTTQQVKENVFRNNPYLACIYCFFTVHVDCLNSRTVRRCPKAFFDENDIENILDEQTQSFYVVPSKDHDSLTATELSPDSLRLMNRSKRVILKLKPEIGLAAQEFHCAECRNKILPMDYRPTSDKKQNTFRALLCDYTGLYFCEKCHFGDTSIIPARVVHNWDFTPYPVSRVALQIISYIRNTAFHYDRPVLLNLVDLNSMLYGLVEDLVLVKRIRTELCQIYKYITICKQPTRPKNWILTQLGEHFLDEKLVAFHSFIDLCDLKNLAINLSEVEQLFINHINSCPGCQGKGFFCELCSNRDDVLFPFSPNTTICIKCSAIYHKNCFYRRNRICPRCARIKDKKLKEESVIESLDTESHVANND